MRRPVFAPASWLLLPLLSEMLTALGCTPWRGPGVAMGSAPPAAPTALAVDSAVVAIARAPLWPGFTPLTTPLAIFDGTRTYLFRHPSPPTGYAAVRGRGDAAVRDGRDSTITANSSASLGGVDTATVMLDPRSRVEDAAALAVHELFHVFQRARHEEWQANEADLFTYPMGDSVALALRREETVALHRALGASGRDSIRCWGAAFMLARGQRFARLGEAASTYELRTELNEGLAQYVERRAAGRAVTVAESDAPAAEVRHRAYDIGAGVAEMLTRLQPGWEHAFDAASQGWAMTLDVPLYDALVGLTPSGGACPAPTARERAAWTAQAGRDVRTMVAERERTRTEYLAGAGWLLVVDAGNAPFFPEGFAPLNVARLSSTEILHTRYLKLRGTLGSIELSSRPSLTEGPTGSHPLFSGVVRLTVARLPDSTVVRDSAGVLVIEAPGMHGRLRGMRADTTGRSIRIWHH